MGSNAFNTNVYHLLLVIATGNEKIISCLGLCMVPHCGIECTNEYGAYMLSFRNGR
jgi:hypothetical protein